MVEFGGSGAGVISTMRGPLLQPSVSAMGLCASQVFSLGVPATCTEAIDKSEGGGTGDDVVELVHAMVHRSTGTNLVAALFMKWSPVAREL